VFFDSAASPYGMFSVKWAPPNGRHSILVSGLIRSGRYNVSEQFHNPNLIDVVYIHALTPRWTYTLDSLFGYETNVPDIRTARWFGIVHYLTCQLSPRWSSTARLEFFDDIDGNRTGFPGLYTAATAGISLKLRPEIVIRQEVRFDNNSESRAFDNQYSLLTACLDVIIRW
jgi:hypothetical protein